MTTPPTRARMTRQRAALVSTLSEARGFISAQTLHDQAKAAGHTIGLATVYRTLQALDAEGLLDVLHLGGPSAEATYRLCGAGPHHHHLTCRTCGTAIEIEAATVETWAHTITEAHGFTDPSHTIEITGVCPACTISSM